MMVALCMSVTLTLLRRCTRPNKCLGPYRRCDPQTSSTLLPSVG